MIEESTPPTVSFGSGEQRRFHVPRSDRSGAASTAGKTGDRSRDVLRAAYQVTRLITKGRDRRRLLQEVCDSLVESRGYYHAWIALLDPSGQVSTILQAGMGDDGSCLAGLLEDPESMDCVCNALSDPTVWTTSDPMSTCGRCPVAAKYAGRGALSVRLGHRDRVFGLLTASTPRAASVDDAEKHLIQEVATDLGYALHAIEQEEARKKGEKMLQERLRELECLYGIARLNEQHEESLQPILQGIVDQLPAAWRHPETCCARIVVNDVSYFSDEFGESPWGLSAGIEAEGESFGVAQVYHSRWNPDRDGAPFRETERRLLGAVANHTGRLVHHFQTSQQFRAQHRALEDANAALRSILGRIEEDKREVSERITTNVDQVVMPLLQTLETEISARQRQYVALVKRHLKEICSPFVGNLSKGFAQLTPAEIQVCQMIRNGLSTKEIAGLRHVAPSTVARQRARIREKLKIAKTGANLASHLRVFASDDACRRPAER